MAQKFRAWIKSKQRMESVASMNWHKDELSRITTRLNGVLSAHLPDDIAHMQSTGIFDENGVEIFDGDILLVENNANGVTWKEVVFYDKEKALFASKEVDLHELEQELYNLLNTTFLKISVVGNIYENPELLEVGACNN